MVYFYVEFTCVNKKMKGHTRTYDKLSVFLIFKTNRSKQGFIEQGKVCIAFHQQC